MKPTLPLLAFALALTSCGKKESASTVSAAASGGGATTPAAAPGGFHPALGNVVANLETDGAHFSVTYIDKDLQQLAGAVDKIIDIARENTDEVPAGLSAKRMLDDLGLAGINAIGRSAKEKDGAWQNRAFLQHDGKRAGLLSVMGGEGTGWRASESAPEGADLVVEFELNLKDLQKTMEAVSISLGDEVAGEYRRAMGEKIGGALTVGDLFGKTDLRAMLVVSMDRSKRWKAEENLELPAMDVALRIERGMWLWKQFGKEIEGMGQVSEADGLKIVKAPEEMPTPMGSLRPTLALDEAKDVIWFSFTEKYLDACRKPSATLAKDADFAKATAGFPASGNGLVYVSKDLCTEIGDLVAQAGKSIGERETMVFELVTGLLGMDGKAPERGYAICISHAKDGILVVGNLPFADKGYGMMGSVSSIAAVAGMTAPMVVRQRGKAEQVMVSSNMRQLGLGLLEYSSDKGRYPNELSELVGAGLIDEDTLLRFIQFEAGGEGQELVYVPGASPDKPDVILIHTPEAIDGKRTCLFGDISVRTIPEQEFQEIMEAQRAEQ